MTVLNTHSIIAMVIVRALTPTRITHSEQTQTQGAEINVKGNSNYVGVNQEQSSGIGSELSGAEGR